MSFDIARISRLRRDCLGALASVVIWRLDQKFLRERQIGSVSPDPPTVLLARGAKPAQLLARTPVIRRTSEEVVKALMRAIGPAEAEEAGGDARCKFDIGDLTFS
jgi:hypothetical protein